MSTQILGQKVRGFVTYKGANKGLCGTMSGVAQCLGQTWNKSKISRDRHRQGKISPKMRKLKLRHFATKHSYFEETGEMENFPKHQVILLVNPGKYDNLP